MTTSSMEAPFGWFTRMGMGLVSFFAQFGEAGSGGSGGYQMQGSSGAAAYTKTGKSSDETGKKPPFPMPACCGVAYPNGPYCDYPGTDPSQYTCPEGWYRQWWFCPDQPPAYGACAECTRSQSTCWSGPFLCSTWWYL